MALFGFRVRSRQRDLQTDQERFERLKQVLADLTAEMERERTGLQARYDDVAADAAYSQQALDDGRTSEAVSARVDVLTDGIIRYSERMTTLDREIAFLHRIVEDVNAFTRENRIDSKAEDRSMGRGR